MGKLKKLNLYKIVVNKIKYPYRVKIHNIPINNEISGYSFTTNEDNSITFYTSKKILNYLLVNNHVIETDYQNKNKQMKLLISRKWLSAVSLIVIFMILLLGKNYIRKIEFSNDIYYSKEVLDVVLEQLDNKKMYYKLKDSINNIGKKLRSRFPYYEWIGLRKEGSILYIDIVDLDPPLVIKPNTIIGNLVADKTAYIINFHVTSGLIVINTNMTVRKGDLLVSGNLNYFDDKSTKKMVSPNGYINGKTLEIIDVLIPKNEEKIVYSGNVESKRKLRFNKKNKKFPTTFKHYYYQMEILFKFGPIDFIKESYFEKQIIRKQYDVNDACEIAKIQIESEFYHIARNQYEKILKIEVLKAIEQSENYLITMLVSKIENIAIFESI